MKRILAVSMSVFLVSGQTVIAQLDRAAEATARSGMPGTHQLTLPDSGRRYTLVIPDGYTGQDAVPLIMSLHYGGQVTPFYGRGQLEQIVEPALSELGCIIVAPDSVAGSWSNAQAEQHVVELFDYVQAHYNIDAVRTLLTGYSMGGMGTWYLAPRQAERFKAAIPMAARPQADSTSLDWRTPMYIIHSTADELMDLEATTVAVEQLRAKNAAVELVVVDGITHFQMSLFQSHLKAEIPWIQDTWSN